MRASRTLPFAVVLAVTASSPESLAQGFTGTYTFGSNINVSSLPYNGTAIDNLTVSALDKVGVVTSNSSGSFRASGWALDSVTVAPFPVTGSIDLAKFFTFTLTAAQGYVIDMSSLTFGVVRNGTGPRTFAWRSDVDSFASNLSDYTATTPNSTFLSLSGGVITLTDTTSTTQTGNVINLSGLANVSSLTLRFYAYNSEATAGTGGLQGDLSFAGTMISTAVPEPSTYGMVLGGLALAGAVVRRRRRA